MSEVRVAPGVPRFIAVAVAIAAGAVVVGVAYRLDRAYARWLTRVSPLTGPRARAVQLRDGYRVRRADASELAHFINDLMDEVARARRDAGM
jgi:hypothetical protein